MLLEDALAAGPVVLTEGAVVERLRRDPAIRLDPELIHAGFVYERAGAAALERIYREYLEIGREYGLPMVSFTATWRATPERIARSRYAGTDVNGDAVRFLDAIRRSYGPYGRRVCLAGLVGCRGDAYRPGESLSPGEALEFHRPQLEALVEAGVDLLFAATLPALPEARGLAAAMARTGAPYVLSFVLRPDGALLDGTPLGRAATVLDDISPSPPLGYLSNCTHPATFRRAMERACAASPALAARVLGLQANTSLLPPDELDGRAELDADPAGPFAEAMASLVPDFGVRVLGGCCGSDASHLRALADRLTADTAPASRQD